MNNKTMGKEIANPIQREQFIKDNADACENKGYMKAYTPEELQDTKRNLRTFPLRFPKSKTRLRKSKRSTPNA